MRFNQLDLNLLVALDAIIAEKSVTKAAARVNLSQSAMSSALNRLRLFFNDDLFVQTGRVLHATPLALDLAEPIRRLLLGVQADVIDRQPFDPALSTRVFSLVASDYMVRVVLSDLARHIAAIAPDVRLNILQFSNENIRQKLKSGEVDFLLSPDTVMLPEMPYEVLFEEDFVAVACRQSRYGGRELSLADFRSAGHVVVRLGETGLAGIDENVCQKAGIERRAEITVGAFDHVAAFLQGTDRLAMLQKGMAEHYADMYPLQLFELPFGGTRIVEALQWHPCNENGQAHQWFRNIALDFIRKQYASKL